MSYTLECELCNHQVEVAEPSARLDQCPDCGSMFTMLPARPRLKAPSVVMAPVARPVLDPTPVPPEFFDASTPLAPESRESRAKRPVDGPAPAVRMTAAVIEKPPTVIPKALLVTEVPSRRAKAEVPVEVMAPSMAPSRKSRRAASHHPPRTTSLGVIDPAGPWGALVGIVALGLLWLPRFSGLAIPLTVFGLLWGLVAVVVAGSIGRPRAMAILGAAISAMALTIAVGPTLNGWFRPKTLTPIPIVNTVGPEWTNATKGGQKQGSVTVEVVNVTLGTAPAPPPPRGADKKAAAKKPAGTLEKVLFVRVRAKTGEGATPTWRDAKPVLTDDAGRELTPRPLAAAKASPPPVAGETIFAFEAPPRVRKFLRLELPGSAVSAPDTFRFTISPEMIVEAGATP